MNYIDLHCDTLYRLYTQEDTLPDETPWENRGHIDLSRLHKAGALAQFFACFLNRKQTPISESHYTDALQMIRLLKSSADRHAEVSCAFSFDDYLRNKSAGKLSCFLTVEEGGILENDMSRLYTLYEEGIRLITLTWNYENELGFPHNMSSQSGTGLKPFGLEVIGEMERLGMLIDVSHLSDAGFEDVYQNTNKPFVASHSCCRALCGHSRNLTDRMIRMIGERQGLVGVNFYGTFLQDSGICSAEVIAEHLRHIVNVGGIDIAALGSDFDGMSCEMELAGCQDMPLLLPALEKAGFTSGEIDAICYNNAERVLKNI